MQFILKKENYVILYFKNRNRKQNAYTVARRKIIKGALALCACTHIKNEQYLRTIIMCEPSYFELLFTKLSGLIL